MEDLIALLIPLLAVAGWLFGLFKNEENEPKRQSGEQGSNRPVSRTESTAEQKKQPQPAESSQKSGTKEYYENKMKQVKELKNETKQASTAITGDEISMGTTAEKPERRVQEDTKKSVNTSSVSLRNNITRRGLAESVMMAEILGQPRALKPYRSITSERKR